MATSVDDSVNEISCRHGSCNIILKPGDLLTETGVDVIVIPTPSPAEQKPESFALFTYMCERASDFNKTEILKIQYDLTQNEPKVLSIKGSGFMFVIPPYIGNRDRACKLLRQTYTSCLELAVKSNYRKIAFPTIGCGVIGFDTAEAAECVYKALRNFCQSDKGKKMNDIRIVIHNMKIYNDFTDSFTKLGQADRIKFTRTPMYDLLLYLVNCFLCFVIDLCYSSNLICNFKSNYVFRLSDRSNLSTTPSRHQRDHQTNEAKE